MKSIKKFRVLFVLILILSVALFASFIRNNSSGQYQYLTIVQWSTKELRVGVQGQEFQVISVNTSNLSNFSPALDKVAALEAEGWELFSNNYSGSTLANYFLMRRKKN